MTQDELDDWDAYLAERMEDAAFASAYRAAAIRASRIAHDHRTYVDGCFRCDLSRDEAGGLH